MNEIIKFRYPLLTSQGQLFETSFNLNVTAYTGQESHTF